MSKNEKKKKYETFAKRLKVARKEAGYKTQLDFADSFSMYLDPNSTKNKIESIRKWEQGEQLPETGTLFKLAEFLNLDIDYLTGRIDEPTHAVKFISNHTGLSISAIKKLESFSEYQTSILSALIEHPNTVAILRLIKELSDDDLIESEAEAIKLHFQRKLSGERTINAAASMLHDSLTYAATRKFSELIDDLTENKTF